MKSGHGPLWAHCRSEYAHSLQNHSPLGRGLDVTGVYDEQGESFRLYWDAGYSAEFPRAAMAKAERVSGGASVPVSREYKMEIIGQGDLLEEMRQALKSDGRYPVDHFLNRLKVADLVFYPGNLKGAYFAYEEALEGSWKDCWVSCRLQHQVFIPESGLELLRDFGDPAADDLLAIELVESPPPPTPVAASRPPCTGLPYCCFCQQPVLKLEGQYARLSEEMLTAQEHRLLSAVAVGTAHTSCLTRTGYGYPWNQRRLEILQQDRGFELIAEQREVQALWDPEKEEAHIFWESGYNLSVGLEELYRYGLTKYGTPSPKLLPRRAVLDLDLSDFPQLNQKLLAASNGGGFPMRDLLGELGITTRMVHYRETLRDGVAEIESSAGSSLRLSFDYFVLVPDDGLELAALGGYPLTSIEDILRRNPHLRSRVRPREQPLALKSDDVLVAFLARYESADSTVKAGFRVPSNFLSQSLTGDPSFKARYREWFIDQKLHQVYRVDSRDHRPVEEFRSDHFLLSLLHNLPEPEPEEVRSPRDQVADKIFNQGTKVSQVAKPQPRPESVVEPTMAGASPAYQLTTQGLPDYPLPEVPDPVPLRVPDPPEISTQGLPDYPVPDPFEISTQGLPDPPIAEPTPPPPPPALGGAPVWPPPDEPEPRP